MTASIVSTVILIVFVGLLGVAALMAWGTANQTKWGINLRSVQCPRCHTQLPTLRKPASMKETLWGGWTCPNCGCKIDKWGRETVSGVPRTRTRVVHLLLLYALVLDVGFIGFFFGFIPHVFFADQAAQLIGWQPGSPFQFEVGFHDGAWGLLGFLCIWVGGSFWLATGLGWSFFMIGATYGTSITRSPK